MAKTLTPKDIATYYGCGIENPLAWLNSGELRGINIARRVGERPRWRITPEDFADFERRRASANPPEPKPKPQRQRRKLEPVANYYPA